jgi:hypothetical protein
MHRFLSLWQDFILLRRVIGNIYPFFCFRLFAPVNFIEVLSALLAVNSGFDIAFHIYFGVALAHIPP